MTARSPFATCALGLAALALASGCAQAASQQWNFAVFLDGKPIGHHDFTLTRENATGELKDDAHFDARFYAIFSYHYAHDALEHWDGNCLTGLTARTDDDGKQSSVNAQRDGNTLTVSGPHGQQHYPGCVMTFAYWNSEMLKQSHLLNPQTGEVEAVRIEPLGKVRIEVHGTPVDANHYRISGPKHPIDLWYSDAGEWLALSSPLDGDRQLEYQLQ